MYEFDCNWAYEFCVDDGLFEHKVPQNRSRSKNSLFKNEFKTTQVESKMTIHKTPLRPIESRNEEHNGI